MHIETPKLFWFTAVIAVAGLASVLPVAFATPTGARGPAASSSARASSPSPGSSSLVVAPPHGSKDPYEKKPTEPGVVHFVRAGKTTAVPLWSRGKLSKDGLSSVSELFAKTKEEKKPIDDALAGLIVKVSDHFGGRPIEVVAGSWSAKGGSKRHVAHTSGRAVDIRVVGVPLDAVRDYCTTLPNAGVGYYPKEQLVHLDVRRKARSWTEQ